jgi:hypothetical protein
MPLRLLGGGRVRPGCLRDDTRMQRVEDEVTTEL